MVINKIELTSFRNYANLTVFFSPNINIIYGENGQGKTNLLESIYVLGITKSHRHFLDDYLIKKGNDYCKIKGNIIKKAIPSSLEIIITNQNKKLKIDNNVITSTTEYITKMNIIIFHPEDIELIKGAPSVRRKYLNTQLSQLHLNYYKILTEYNKILKQRNELLKKIQFSNSIDESYLTVLTDALIERAYKIYQYRQNYVENINRNIANIYQDIMNYPNFKIYYKPIIKINSYHKEDLIETLKEAFVNNYNNEIRTGSTVIGPHRDDFEFFIDENNLKVYGSQGQQRGAVIALKLSEIPIFKTYKETYPILLLDDVFSELDDNKKNNLLKYITHDIQTFITTTDLNSISSVIIEQANLIKIKKGKIIEKE